MAVCTRCRHYYTTWDKRFPHGCRALKFKSAHPPYQAVRRFSGMECLAFQSRPKRAAAVSREKQNRRTD